MAQRKILHISYFYSVFFTAECATIVTFAKKAITKTSVSSLYALKYIKDNVLLYHFYIKYSNKACTSNYRLCKIYRFWIVSA